MVDGGGARGCHRESPFQGRLTRQRRKSTSLRNVSLTEAKEPKLLASPTVNRNEFAYPIKPMGPRKNPSRSQGELLAAQEPRTTLSVLESTWRTASGYPGASPRSRIRDDLWTAGRPDWPRRTRNAMKRTNAASIEAALQAAVMSLRTSTSATLRPKGRHSELSPRAPVTPSGICRIV
jgi:hypothetical protein